MVASCVEFSADERVSIAFLTESSAVVSAIAIDTGEAFVACATTAHCSAGEPDVPALDPPEPDIPGLEPDVPEPDMPGLEPDVPEPDVPDPDMPGPDMPELEPDMPELDVPEP